MQRQAQCQAQAATTVRLLSVILLFVSGTAASENKSTGRVVAVLDGDMIKHQLLQQYCE